MALVPYALVLHFLFLVLAVSASAIAFASALKLRDAPDAGTALDLLAASHKITPLYPVSTLGLLLTGAYMTQVAWTWTTPWILASIVGLLLIVAIGSGVEGGRARRLVAELRAAGLSDRARRLLRDPVAWTARLATHTLLVAVIVAMTTRPGAVESIVILALALICAAPLARPFWTARTRPAADIVGRSES